MDPALARRMTAHVTRLAEDHDVTVHWIRSWRHAQAFPGERSAFVPKIRRPSDYLVALHEIGHTADPTSHRLVDATDRHSGIVCEAAAWAWATEHALPSLRRAARAEDWQRVADAFTTYLRKEPRAA